MSWDDFYKTINLDLKRVFDKYCEYAKKVTASTFPLEPSFDITDPILEVAERGSKVFVVIDRVSVRPQAKLRYALLKKR